MKQLFRNEIFVQIIKFGFVGLAAFLIDYFFLLLFHEIFHISVFLSTALAFTISVIFNYLASVKWVFTVYEGSSKRRNFILFILFSIMGLVITEIIMYIGTDIAHISYQIVKIFATGVVMVFNFITRKIFLEKK